MRSGAEFMTTQAQRISKCLLRYGSSIGNFMVWHSSKSPYEWLIAEIMLRRTTRTVVEEVYPKFLENFPDWHAVMNAPEDRLAQVICRAGLVNQRVKCLKALSEAV